MTGISTSSLTVIARVRAGARDELRERLQAADEGESPFARVAGTHFARWVLIPALKGADGRWLESEGSFLLMSAEFDSSPGEWTAALCANAGAAFDAVMGYCEGYPGSGDPAAVARFFAAHETRAGFTVAGHPRARVEQIQEALVLRERLRALALRGQAERLRPAELRAAWREVSGR